MTGFLASVSSIDEAELVRSLGTDVIDLKNPDEGALGAVDVNTAQTIVSMIGSKTTLSATIGDLPLYAGDLESRVGRMHETGVDIIKVGVFDKSLSRFALNALGRLAGGNIRIVLVFFAEFFTGDIANNVDFPRLKKTGIEGAMLDTCEKANGNLRKKLDDRILAEFVTNTKQAGLVSGLAGSLTGADIPPLLRLNPDYLGFRGALCKENKRNMQIDGIKVSAIRHTFKFGASCQTRIVRYPVTGMLTPLYPPLSGGKTHRSPPCQGGKHIEVPLLRGENT